MATAQRVLDQPADDLVQRTEDALSDMVEQSSRLTSEVLDAEGSLASLWLELMHAQVTHNLEATQDPGAYGVFAIMSEGQTAEAGQAALAAQLARMRDTLVTQAELDEAKNEIVTAKLQQRETAEGRADDNPESVRKRLEKNRRLRDPAPAA